MVGECSTIKMFTDLKFRIYLGFLGFIYGWRNFEISRYGMAEIDHMSTMIEENFEISKHGMAKIDHKSTMIGIF